MKTKEAIALDNSNAERRELARKEALAREQTIERVRNVREVTPLLEKVGLTSDILTDVWASGTHFNSVHNSEGDWVGIQCGIQ